MNLLLTTMILVTSHGLAGTIITKESQNNYFTMSIPESSSVSEVGGKPGEMQIQLSFHGKHTDKAIFIFAYWDGLDPRRFVGTNVVTQYSLDGRDYYLKSKGSEEELEMILSGQKYHISVNVPLVLEKDDLALLLGTLATLKPK